ncbi:NADH-quinone oxidoreductase subunit NuoH [Rickettsiales bacterium]|nr:NADH-quinone oxidoreductase subunit NuoH [Rickettsiales bacterium]
MFFDNIFFEISIIIFKIFLIIIPLLLFIAYLTYFERKIIGSIQLRKGPNVVGPFGLLQPIADGIKLLTKETIIPTSSNKLIFLFSPILTFTLALVAWVVIPIDYGIVLSNINVGILYIFAISSLGVYGIIMAGWSSNSRYAFLGALRSAAQMISYEVSIGLIIINILLTVGSLNLTEIVLAQKNMWFFIPHFPVFIIFFISTLAETNRAPFDLPEAEAELVAGYNVEYSSLAFGLFFLGEYGNMILMSSLTTILFLGGWYPPLDIDFFYNIPGFVWFFLKVCIILFLFVWIRATLPRYRYDQLMRLGWKVFLPISLFWIVVTSSYLFFFEKV